MTPPPLLPHEDQTRLDQVHALIRTFDERMPGQSHRSDFPQLLTILAALQFQEKLIADLAWLAANQAEPICRKCKCTIDLDQTACPMCCCKNSYKSEPNWETYEEAQQRALATRRGGVQ